MTFILSVRETHVAVRPTWRGRCGPRSDSAARGVAKPSVDAAFRILVVRLRELKVGCFGGGTGLPSLLGGLKTVPWLDLHAIVTMFDSGGSSGPVA